MRWNYIAFEGPIGVGKTSLVGLLTERLGAWLTPMQIEALLARRDLIITRADELVAERGQGAVLYQ